MASDHVKLTIHTSTAPNVQADCPAGKTHSRRRIRVRTRLSFQERLLRNSFLACAVLLGILALGNIRQPWAQKASNSIEQALTMTVDLDQSLGQLSFVRRLMPESALVFFNLDHEHEFAMPVQGELAHPYTGSQPWLMFKTEANTPVYAVADGTISAVSPLSDGSFGVLIDHGSGLESVIANLRSVELQPGDGVVRGGRIAQSGGDLFYELRQGGNSIDPSSRLGL